jgi:hypothetical protein
VVVDQARRLGAQRVDAPDAAAQLADVAVALVEQLEAVARRLDLGFFVFLLFGF